MTDDEKVAQRYRELGAEEPPRALDEAILAAARREAGSGPAPLSARGSRQRWYAPLATAAVLVLAVAVTLNMQHEQPGIDSPATPPAPPRADQPAAQQELKLKAEEQLASVAKQPAIEMNAARRKDTGQVAPAVPAASAVREPPQPFAADRAAAAAGASAPAASRADDARGFESSVTGPAARQMEERTSRDAEAAARAPRLGPLQAQLAKRAEDTTRAKSAAAESTANLPAAPAAAPTPAPAKAAAAEPTPERELERIADLRRQERHEEADKALAEFRKRHPDYRISGAMLERVERR
jgi:hypothetical protein